VNRFTIEIARAWGAPEPEDRCSAEIGRPRLRLRHAEIRDTRLDGEAPLRPPDML
jgi:hypothetical protein